jgi:two-component system, NarL family, captular synthesis response regulator RcsB
MLLQQHVGYAVMAGQATTGNQWLELLAQQPCNLCIVDLFMPIEDGLDDGFALLQRLQGGYPPLQLIALTTQLYPTLINAMLAHGVMAVVSKTAALEDLVCAIQTVRLCRIFMSKCIRAQLQEHIRGRPLYMPPLPCPRARRRWFTVLSKDGPFLT